MSMLKYILCVFGLSVVAVGALAMMSDPPPQPAPSYPFNAPYNIDLSQLSQAFRH